MASSVNISDALGDSNVNSDLTFTVPTQFVRINLDENPDTRIPRTYARLGTSGKFSEEHKFHIIYAQELAIAQLRAENALYYGLCLSLNDDGKTLSTAQFTVIVKNVNLSGENSLASIAQSQKLEKPHREIMLYQLPAGEALAVGEELLIKSPQFHGDISKLMSTVTRQAQIIVPLPHKKKAAFFSIASDNLADWPHYISLLNSIVHTVSFGNTNTRSISAELNLELDPIS